MDLTIKLSELLFTLRGACALTVLLLALFSCGDMQIPTEEQSTDIASVPAVEAPRERPSGPPSRPVTSVPDHAE